MNRLRRALIQSASIAAALSTFLHIASAQSYPTHPVRIVVGFSAGGTTDIGARMIAQYLSKQFGQPFVVENKPGAGTHLATESVAHAPADGYTLLMATPSNAINATLYPHLNYNFLRDIVPVAGVLRSPFVLEVNPAVPVKTSAELIAYVKAHPGTINMASFGTGTSSHLTGELFKMRAGIEMLHIPYRGSAPMLIDLLAGHVQAAFDNLPASIEYIRSGKLRALAVTTAAPSDALPGVPTLAETLPGFEASAWIGVTAPKGTAPEIIDRLNREINAALADPQIKLKFRGLSGTPLGGSAADFGKLIAEETEKWGNVVRTAKIQPE